MKLFVTVNQKEEIPRFKEKGVTPVLALQGHSLTALPGFSLQEIQEEKNCGVLMNRFYFEEDLPELKETLRKLQQMEVSCIYFSDPSVLYYAGSLKEKLVYQSETLSVSVNDISFWENRGVQSVFVSPLLTKEEIMEILSGCAKAEVMLFGYSVVSQSYRKLLSAYETYGNLTVSLKENRNLSLREKTRTTRMPVYENDLGTVIYSDYILSCFQQMDSFVQAGLQRGYLDSVFLGEETILDALDVFQGRRTEKEFLMKHQNLFLDEGYYAKKTVR